MKTMMLFLSMICICAVGLAQQNDHNPQLRPGIICIYETPEGLWIADGYPPSMDPHAIATINPAFIFPLDGSGPIALDPTMGKRINPYLVYLQDKIDPGLNHTKAMTVNPSFLIEFDRFDPIPLDPSIQCEINPNYINPEY